jgi:hypothetical protein
MESVFIDWDLAVVERSSWLLQNGKTNRHIKEFIRKNCTRNHIKIKRPFGETTGKRLSLRTQHNMTDGKWIFEFFSWW